MFYSLNEELRQSRYFPTPKQSLGIDISISACLVLYITTLLESASCDIQTGQATRFRVRTHADRCALHMNLETFFNGEAYNELLLADNGFDALTRSVIEPFYKQCMELDGRPSVLHGYCLKSWFTESIEQTAQSLCSLANDFLATNRAEQTIISIV